MASFTQMIIQNYSVSPASPQNHGLPARREGDSTGTGDPRHVAGSGTGGRGVPQATSH